MQRIDFPTRDYLSSVSHFFFPAQVEVFGAGSIAEAFLGEDETSGMAIDFVTDGGPEMLIRGSGQYLGDPIAEYGIGSDAGKLTFSRASLAMKYNQFGTLEFSGHNLLVRSEAFDNASWGKNAVSATADQTTAPDGTSTADLIAGNGANGEHEISQSVSFSAARSYAFSVYAKKNTNNFIQLVQLNTAFPDNVVYANFDLDAGTIGTIAGSASATIESMGSGWYRCTLIGTADATTTDSPVIVLVSGSTAARREVWTTSNSVYLWGAQLQALPCSDDAYVPTTSSAVYKHRYDYNPQTLAPRGLLIEEQRTNVVTFSENIDANGTRNINGVTVTDDQTTAPDGTSTADLITENALGGNHFVEIGGITRSANQPVACSIYAKKGTRNFIFMHLQIAGGNYALAVFDLNNGVVGETVVAGGGVASNSIQNVGNDWYRCIAILNNTTDANGIFNIGLASLASGNSLDGNGRPDYTGTSSTQYWWGMQAEVNANFATSYIPTTSASATRAADLVSIATSLFPFSATEGSFVAQFMMLSTSGGSYQGIIGISDGTTNERIQIFRQTDADDLVFQIVDGGSQVVNVTLGDIIGLNHEAAAAAWVANDAASVLNGGTVQTDASFTLPTVNQLWLGKSYSSTGDPYNGWIRKAAYLPRRMTNSELQQRTRFGWNEYGETIQDYLGDDENEGMAIDFLATTPRVLIRDDVNTLSFLGTPFANGLGYRNPGKLTFSRASGAMRYAASGTLEWAPHNLVLRSQEFDSGSWTKEQASVTANATKAPDGTNTADKLVATTGSANHDVYQQQTVVTEQRRASVYAKAAEFSWLCISMHDDNGTHQSYFNLATGVLGTSQAGNTASIESVGNGWYRCTVTREQVGGAYIILLIAEADNDNSLVGDNVSGIYIWGAQWQRLPCSDTRYIPTTSAAVHVERYDYNPSTLAARGLLIEEQRTNLVLRSQEFDNASWTSNGTTETANSTTSPDGTTTADTLVGNGAASIHEVNQSVSFTSGTAYSYSLYAKKNTLNHVQLVFPNAAFPDGACYANFDLDTGSVGTVGGSATASIQNVGSGWYRCVVTATADATVSDIVTINLISSSTATRRENWTTSNSIYVWGAQLEAGSFPTSYIPTTSASATRAADVVTMATNLKPFSSTVGLVVASFELMSLSQEGWIFHYDPGRISYNYNPQPLFFVDNSGIQCSIDAGTLVALTQHNWASSWATNDFATSLDSGAVGTDTSGTIPAVTTLRLGSRSENDQFLHGWLRKFKHFPRNRVDNAELQSLSAG